MKIIIDTNLWISFLIGKQTFRLKELLTRKGTVIFVCRELLNELMDVASRPKLRKYISQEDILQLLQIIELYCLDVVIQAKAISDIRDAKDLYLLSLADAVQADYLLTGDKDLLVLGKHGQTTILTLSDFLIQLSGQGQDKA